MARNHHFEISTELPAEPGAVWAHCTSMNGVTRELRPWLRMTFPPKAATLTPESVTLGERIFRSWILLFGVVPVDWDDIVFVELEPGHRFLERSSMATQRLWQHERIVESAPGGARITDRLDWEGRFPGAAFIYDVIVPRLFAWRHRQLKRLFGS